VLADALTTEIFLCSHQLFLRFLLSKNNFAIKYFVYITVLVSQQYSCFIGCREELQEAQMEAAKENRVPCRNCGRRFNSDRVSVHERICKGPGKGGMVGGGGGDDTTRESMNGNMTGGKNPQKSSGSRVSLRRIIYNYFEIILFQ